MKNTDAKTILSNTTDELRAKVAAECEKQGGELRSRQVESLIRVLGPNLAAGALCDQALAHRVESLEAKVELLGHAVAMLIDKLEGKGAN